MVLLIDETVNENQKEDQPKYLPSDKSIELANDSDLSSCESNSTTERRLSWKIKIFYSVGHVYNDLSVAMWFAYTLLFFKFQFSDSLAGALLLIGQVADAFFSPVVGFVSDKNPNWFIFKYGKRKIWHLLGVIFTTLSLPFTYNTSPFGEDQEISRFLYYSFFVIIFQSGWAATQIAHVSILTDLTDLTDERLSLNVFRQMATVASNICMYSVTLFVIGFGDNKTMTKDDLYVFTYVAYIVCAIGLVFSALFHIFVKEPDHKHKKMKPEVFTIERDLFIESSKGSTTTVTLLAMRSIDELEWNHLNLNNEQNLDDNSISKLVTKTNTTTEKREKNWKDWLKSFSFWKITIMYTMARMFVNLTQVYTPLYLQDTLQMPKKTIAIIPFATYFFGFIFSFIAKPLSTKFGSRSVLIVGLLFGIGSSIWILFGAVDDDSYKTWQIYFVSTFLGISGTALLISTLALTSDLIGTNSGTGAFVFAAMSFVDKNYNGIVIELLQRFNPPVEEIDGVPKDPVLYYKYVMIALTSCATVAVAIGFITIFRSNYGKKSDQSLKNVITAH